MKNIKIVVGSWGSYNLCNERALGSKWLDLSLFESFDDVKKELASEGFELAGIDEELFVQDVDGIPADGVEWDDMNVEKLCNAIFESEILKNDYKYKLFCNFLEVESLSRFFELVDEKGDHWNDEIIFYEGYDWDDLGREMFDACGGNLPDFLENCFDFEEFGLTLSIDGYTETADGIICIC